MAKASLDFPGLGSSLNTAEMRVEEVQEPRDSRKFLCRDKRREQTNQQECKDGEFVQVLHSLQRQADTFKNKTIFQAAQYLQKQKLLRIVRELHSKL